MTTAEDLAARLRAQIDIDDMFTGRASPAEVEARSRAWPTSPEWRDIERLSVTEQGDRRVEEYRYHPADGRGVQPVGIMFERTPAGSRARIYAQHQWVADRGPILAVDETLDPAAGPDDILARYFATLRSADLEATLALWEDDGYLQHSNGETFQGRERLKLDFMKFYETGGIKLRYCNKTDDGRVCALEVYMPSGRPALAVYERGATARVAAARLYL